MGARLYDPTLGRFLSVDPILTPNNPRQNNGYNYGWNNPLTSPDPSGMEPRPGHCKVGCSPGLGFTPEFAEKVYNNILDRCGISYPTQGLGGGCDQVAYMAKNDPMAALKYDAILGGTLQEFPENTMGNWEALGQGFANVGNFIYKASGASDAIECASGEFKSCMFAALGAVPGLGASGRAAAKALGHAADAAGDVTKAVAKRPAVIRVGGVELPGVPVGATGTPARTGKGLLYEIPAGTPGLDSRVTGIRVMDPVTSGAHQYPNGYVSYLNRGGQAVHPQTGRTLETSDPMWHIPIS